MPPTEDTIQLLVREVSVATASSPNEENLRHELENALERACRAHSIPWTPYQLERTLRPGGGRAVMFTDVAHGAVVIEYESPGSFRGREGRTLTHARQQAQEYAEALADEEGRPLDEYVLVVWDGAHISFGRRPRGMGAYGWDRLTGFNDSAARRLLSYLERDGIPLVHPRLLSTLVGPESELGSRLLPKLYTAIRAAGTVDHTTKTKLMYTEWRRLFGQVVGAQSERLQQLLAEQGRAHNQVYLDNPAAYLYALNSYIALVAKVVAALALDSVAKVIIDASVPVDYRVELLESGRLFANAGVTNMLNGDFFSWYRDDEAWPSYAVDVAAVIDSLAGVSFDVSRKTAESTRDLFKGMYMSFVPRALRHALGEYYTPDWLAAHALDMINWTPSQALLDPTCGSGTFLLEALKRRLAVASPDAHAATLLDGLHGIDLNPLAVLAARASLVVYLGPRFNPDHPVPLPVYLADAINPATSDGRTYSHRLQTELGVREFRAPAALVHNPAFFDVMSRIRELIDAHNDAADITATVYTEFKLGHLTPADRADWESTIATLVDLHERGWDGIWCAILADRFAAGGIPPSPFVAGNPPWVKWSNLPPEYADFIKDHCLELGVFSVDRWVGGIESDISTVVTYEVAENYLAPNGVLAFFITGTVFANESSQGFRRWRLQDAGEDLRVVRVEDYEAIAPFEGAVNHATLLILTRGEPTSYPITYRIWKPPTVGRTVRRGFRDSTAFREEATHIDLLAAPVPGSDAGPWLKGTAAQHSVWQHLFGSQTPAYRARKGITTDANGVYFVNVAAGDTKGTVRVTNDPALGRRRGLPTVTRNIEPDHVFPLLRGEGVSAFRAIVDPTYHVVVPQRGMHGDPALPTSAPRTWRFLSLFEPDLERRSSYRRFQQRTGAPFWSVWSTGPYTFAPHKVAWREMPGGRFAAAYAGEHTSQYLGKRVVIPDHKLYFVPCETKAEAMYLVGLLNAPLVATAVSAYAAQLSLGANVVEYLLIPLYDQANDLHREVATLAETITRAGGSGTVAQLSRLDQLAVAIKVIPQKVLAAMHAEMAAPAATATSPEAGKRRPVLMVSDHS